MGEFINRSVVVRLKYKELEPLCYCFTVLTEFNITFIY